MEEQELHGLEKAAWEHIKTYEKYLERRRRGIVFGITFAFVIAVLGIVIILMQFPINVRCLATVFWSITFLSFVFCARRSVA